MSENANRLPRPTLSNAAAASQLGISIKAVKAMIEQGELATVKLPLKQRPRLLQTSVDEAYSRLYEPQPSKV